MAQPARKPAPREQPREPVVEPEVLVTFGSDPEASQLALEKVADILLEVLLTSDSE